MKATLDYIERRFDEFNKLMFGGNLKPVDIRLSSARRSLGKVKYSYKRNRLGSYHYSDFTILISSRLDLPKRLLDDTIIHEMIHYWILSNQMRDTSSHGDIFMAKMREINDRFNRNITVSHRSNGDDNEIDTEARQHLICVSRFNSGQVGITIACRSRIFMLWDAMLDFPDVVSREWFISQDSFYNKYPRSMTPKIYRITIEELDDHSGDFRPLIREGVKIIVGRQ